jgi:hypothetical protein
MKDAGKRYFFFAAGFMIFTLPDHGEQGKVGEIQDECFQARFLWIKFVVFPLALELPFDVLNDFFPSHAIFVIQPTNPFLNGNVHPDLAAAMDEPVNKTVRVDQNFNFDAH